MLAARVDMGAIISRCGQSGLLEVALPMRRGSGRLPGPLGRDVLLELSLSSSLDLLVTLDTSRGRIRGANGSAHFQTPLRSGVRAAHCSWSTAYSHRSLIGRADRQSKEPSATEPIRLKMPSP